MAEAHILTLPQELLQNIANYVDTSTGILNLRLTCRELAGAAFDCFVEEYISELSCFVLDPRRLKRVISITANPHLARRIRKLTFNFCPFERDYYFDINIAPQENQAQDSAAVSFMRDHTKAEFEKLGQSCFTLDASKQTLVHIILKSLAPYASCAVHVDSREPSLMQADQHIEPLSLDFLGGLLNAASRAGRPIDYMTLTKKVLLDEKAFDHGGSMIQALPMLQHVRRFTYARALGAAVHDKQELSSHLKALKSVMKHLTFLEELDWRPDLEYTLKRESSYLTTPDLQWMPNLKVLSLSSLRCPYGQLHQTLMACSPTLTEITLWGVYLKDLTASCTRLLRLLRAMPNLQKLWMYDWHDGYQRLGVLVPGDTTFTVFDRNDVEDPVFDSGEFIDWNFEHGLRFMSVRET
ncbi:hypothetical protein PRZ48_005663 [Zasmidium cellare]|uniref:F-box domain-containing protein n=1 Tax=Zasmidium cellare TaxID=395010 RepID=A0ABR0EN48_ZASCE|nr:hypothetical protein PRZ48_005663 [Zasmidium cellare]